MSPSRVVLWLSQQVRGLQHAGGRVHFHAVVLESELQQKAAGGFVLRKVAGEQGPGAESAECVPDHRRGGFKTNPLPPVLRPQMKPQFENAGGRIVGPEPTAPEVTAPEVTAPGMNVAVQQEHRPVLKAILPLEPDLRLQPRADLLRRERAPEKLGDARVAPEFNRERKVVFLPA